jgi:putative ABC transport system permease protein
MWRATFKNLYSHKLRLALTTLAVVLGVGFISGTLVLGDTMRAAFADAFGELTGKVDVQVRGETEFGKTGGGDEREPVPAAVVERIAGVEGVAAVEPQIEGYAQLLDRSGEPIGGGEGPPAIGGNVPRNENLAGVELRKGRYPRAPDEAAIDADTAKNQGFAVDDTVGVVVPTGPARRVEIVGIVGFGELDNLGGATLVMFDRETALELFSPEGEAWSTVAARAESGISRQELADRVAAAVGPGFEVLTSEEVLDVDLADVSDSLSFLTALLLLFGTVSLFVGALMIANTFSIIITQRTRELALLRALGASRAQVLASVVIEAAIPGLLGSAAGLGLGLGVAAGLGVLLKMFGIDLPDAPLVFVPRTAAIAVGVGLVVTIMSALGPALKATRVPPVAALRTTAAPPPSRPGAIRFVGGLTVIVLGVSALVTGFLAGDSWLPVIGAAEESGETGSFTIGAGTLLTMAGAALLGAQVMRPLISVLGWPLTHSLTGQLARENALRDPHRTAATASAMMIRLGLVAFGLVVAQSARASATVAIERTFVADFQVRASGSEGFPPQVVRALDALPEVSEASLVKSGEFRHGREVLGVVAVDPDAVGETLALNFAGGGPEDFRSGGVLLSEEAAEAGGLAVGDAYAMEFAATGEQRVPVAGVIEGSGLGADFVLDTATFEENFEGASPMQVNVRLANGVGVEEARPKVERALAPFPTAEVRDAEEAKEQAASNVDELLGLLLALLLLSILVALLGIANTLSLSVFERFREIGLLRAVGATQMQVRMMMRREAVLVALVGGILGVGVGLPLGWGAVRALADQGITEFALPVFQLVATVLLAGAGGPLAATLPARRASRIDVLQAVAIE